jgi:hypothetical protein
MILQIFLALIVGVALAYLFRRQLLMAREVKELQATGETYVTLDDWDSSVLPKLDVLEESHGTLKRHTAMLAAAVRALERNKPQFGESAAKEVESFPCSDAEADDCLEEAAADAAHTEDQIQAMLSSVANIFGMGRQRGSTEVHAAFAAGLPSFAGLPTRLVISHAHPTAKTSSHPIVEEEPDDEVEEEAEDEELA